MAHGVEFWFQNTLIYPASIGFFPDSPGVVGTDLKIYIFVTASEFVELQLAKAQQQLIATESIVRQLRAAEEDFNQALAAKDSQLAVLRVRIEQSDQEIQEMRSQIKKFKIEREQ